MNSFHHLLMKSYAKMHKTVMSKATERGLTAGQPKILEFLKEKGCADQKTIALHCEIEAATVGSILLRMERTGLVFRDRADEDRRAVIVRLTAEGKKAAEEAEKIFGTSEEKALSGFSDGEKEQLRILLQRIYDNLKLSEDIQ